MSSPSWEEIERAVAAVLELPEQERAGWLSQQPVAIRDEVESLLAAYRRSGDFLGHGTAGHAVGSNFIGRMEAMLARAKDTVAASPGYSPPAVNTGTQL